MKSFFRYAADRICLYRSLKIALVVGTINAVITQYDVVFKGMVTFTNLFQIALTYMVPFGVAFFSAVMQARYDSIK